MAMMNLASDRHLIRALKKPSSERNSKDIDLVVQFLKNCGDDLLIKGLSPEEVRHIASQARYEWRDADELLFTSEDDTESSCFVLVSGLVYVENRLAYPGAVIRGSRGAGRGVTECIVLEPSEFLAIDFSRRVDIGNGAVPRRRALSSAGSAYSASARVEMPIRQTFLQVLSDPFLEESSVDNDTNQPGNNANRQSPLSGHEVSAMVGHHGAATTSKKQQLQQQFSKRPLSGDDTSSVSSFASSNAAVPPSVQGGGMRRGSTTQQGGSSLTVDDIDLTGLTESAVDSDDDLLSPTEENSNSEISDVYRECLEKNPGQRSEHDIDLLQDFVQNFPAFANLTQNAKRSLCQVMTYAVVEEAGAVILSDGDELDSWSVIINGALERRLPDGAVHELGVGESFGVESTRDKPSRRHCGVLRTLVPYCQFIVVSRTDYVSVLSRAEQDKQVVHDKGHVVLVMEERDFVIQPGMGGMPQFSSLPRSLLDANNSGGNQQTGLIRSRRVPVVIRGTVDRLIELVVPQITVPNQAEPPANASSHADPTFSEDFLTTFPLFLDSVSPICDFLIKALRDSSSPLRQKKAANVITHWISADFGLFERLRELGDFLESVEQVLEETGQIPQLKLLLLATNSRSRPRHVVITKAAMISSAPSPDPTSGSNLNSNNSGQTTTSPATGPNLPAPPHRPTSSNISNLDAAGFQITGGLEQRAGIFVSQVQRNGAAWRAGLRRGDQILHVNNHDFTSATYNRALDILLGTSHLALTVKYNKLGLQSISGLAQNFISNVIITSSSSTNASRQPHSRPSLPPSGRHSTNTNKSEMKNSATTGNVRSISSAAEHQKHGTRLSRLVAKVSKKLGGGKGSPPAIAIINEESSGVNMAPAPGNLLRSRSNPDLISGILPKRNPFPDPPDQAVIVYTPEQEHRYFLIRSDTTAADLIGMAFRDFGLDRLGLIGDPNKTISNDPLGNYALFEVTVHPTTQSVRTRRLLDDRSDLAERLPVCARYYLRQISTASSQSLIGPSEVSDVTSEMSKVNLLTMRPRLVALVLTLAEFEAFEQIQPLDYIDDVLALTDSHNTRPALLSSGGGHARVEAMTVLSNRQLFWVISEITAEQKLRRRVQLIQFFIKLAGFCLRLNNFESTFAIVAGLGHSAVVRLNGTWARVSPKYKKLLEDYRELFDPSRNMSRYRNHIARLQREGRLCPAVPLFPLVKKDLAFVHLGNSTFVSENDADPTSGATLINVEKLRMLGREVRQIRQLCAERYPGKELFEQVFFGPGADANPKGVVAGISGGWLTLGRRKGTHHANLGRISGCGNDSPASSAGPKQIYSAIRTRKQIEFYLNSRLHFPPSRSNMSEAIPVIDESAKVCCDEKHLMVLSRQCEPDLPPNQPSSATKSSFYNQTQYPTTPLPPPGPVAPKFGTVEGQNISKMMSLCKEVKPHAEKSTKPLPGSLIAAVSHSPAPTAIPTQLRSPTGQRIPRNLIYQYVLQQQMTDIQTELRRRPIARLSSESSSVVPASLRSPGTVSSNPGSYSRSQSSTSSGFAHFN